MSKTIYVYIPCLQYFFIHGLHFVTEGFCKYEPGLMWYLALDYDILFIHLHHYTCNLFLASSVHIYPYQQPHVYQWHLFCILCKMPIYICVTPVFMSMLALPRGQGLRARLNQEGGNANIEEEKVCNINVFTLLSTCSLGSISNRSTFCLIDCLHICLSWIESPDDVHIQQ